jgi:uncharacterized OB-fold protein
MMVSVHDWKSRRSGMVKLYKNYVYAYKIRLHTVTVKNWLLSHMSKHDQEDDEVGMRMKCAVAKMKGKEDANCRRRATE